MNVFVLCTGRCGSVTFSKACEHITNYTVGHETHYKLLGLKRWEYPDQHIEIEPRLAWQTGMLAQFYPSAFYVHLKRNVDEVIHSYTEKFVRRQDPIGQGRAWWELMGRKPKEVDIRQMIHDMVCTARMNIDCFLADRPHIQMDIEDIQKNWGDFWTWIGARGDYEKASREFVVHYNSWENPSG